jgi:hypothetical protein
VQQDCSLMPHIDLQVGIQPAGVGEEEGGGVTSSGSESGCHFGTQLALALATSRINRRSIATSAALWRKDYLPCM